MSHKVSRDEMMRITSEKAIRAVQKVVAKSGLNGVECMMVLGSIAQNFRIAADSFEKAGKMKEQDDIPSS